MKANLLERLESGVMIGDGAMGTLLYERGLPLDRCCEELILTQPDTVRRVHDDYLAAGARMIETNSFSANRVKLAKRGLESRTIEINARAAQLAAKAAAGKDALIAGSVGPLGLPLEDALAQKMDVEGVFREQVRGLLEGGADFIQLETFSDLDELKFALRAVRAEGKMPVVCSMSFTEDGVTHRGVPMEKAFGDLRAAGADVVGANCCIGPRALASLFSAKILGTAKERFSAFPNAGRPEFMDGRYFYLTTPDYFAQMALGLVNSGVRLIGGCCGTHPEHIAALHRALQSHPSGSRISVGVRTPSEEREAPGAPTRVVRPTLPEIMKQRTLIVTEYDSPKTLSLDRMMAAARALKEAGTDFITVADNSLAILRMNGVVASHLVEKETGLRAIVHLACRDRNLIGTQSELMGMDALGLDHVLAITGDPSKVGDSPGATSVYDLNSISLLEGIRSMNAGRTFGGRDLKRPTRFVAGCSFNPNVPKLDAQVKRLERKVAAGAQFVMTQPVFDRASVRKTREALGGFQVPILVGVLPLLNARNTEFLHNEVPGIVVPEEVRTRMRGKDGDEGAKEGLAISREIAAEVLAHFKGIYLITPLIRYEATVELSAAIRSGKV